jgi:hypothetical protein
MSTTKQCWCVTSAGNERSTVPGCRQSISDDIQMRRRVCKRNQVFFFFFLNTQKNIEAYFKSEARMRCNKRLSGKWKKDDWIKG